MRSGKGHYFKAIDPGMAASIRAKNNKQSTIAGIGSATVSRIERGSRVQAPIARKYYVALETDIPFADLFEPAPQRVGKDNHYTWEQITAAAINVGKNLFEEFQADTILTFSGASAIFSHLVMAKTLSKEQILRMPVYTASFIDKGAPAEILSRPTFQAIETLRFVVLLPDAFTSALQGDTERKKRVAIIDDSITTGSSMKAVKRYLLQLGYDAAQIRAACCVCYQGATLDPETTPDICAFTSTTLDYSLPWGERL